jgi:tetratricopeptide (TPR) repeat protein
MKRPICLVVVTVALLLGGCATAQRGAIGRAYSALRDGRYDSALARLSEAEKLVPPTPELQAEISFLRARSYEGLKRLPEAVGSYKYLAATFPKSIYAFQATERLKELTAK